MLTTFGELDGRAIREVRLATPEAEAKIIEYGAVVRDLAVRRRDGGLQRVVLGLNSVEDYVAHSPHFGAIAGRYANRIRNGRFSIDGKTHQVVCNQDGRHHLHGGGPTGFGKTPWTLVHHDGASATLVRVSPDGENGFPGTVVVTCRYRLIGKTLRIELTGTTDAPTLLNLCHHSYFNLDGSSDILDHTLTVRSNVYTPVDGDLIPDGTLLAVSGTPYDFRTARPVRCKDASGTRVWYDHNYILRRERTEQGTPDGLEVAHAATLASTRSGLAMQVWTSEPAIQVYDGAKLALPVTGLDGARYEANAGLCLEPHHSPDSPNLPHFPTTVLRPGHLYRQLTEYRFTDT